MSSRLRILQVVHTLEPSVGGVAPAMLALSDGLVKRGHSIDIVTLDAAVSPRSATVATNKNIRIHQLGPGLTSYRYSPRLTNWLQKQGNDYDRVIVNGIWQYLSFAVWRHYAKTGTPYFVFPHGMLDPWFKTTHPLKHFKKWLYWPWADYRVLRDAAAVIFTSEEERVQARKSFWLYRARERISPLGIEQSTPASSAASEKFFERFPELRAKRVFLFLGRLHPKKGCDLLIAAFRKLQPANSALILAGPDQIGWRGELSEQSAGLPIVFTGMLEGETKRAAFACADAFILPSHQENFGMSVIEALALGVPVLISNRVNIWREIEADRAGYVDNDDLAGTTRLIERWLATSDRDRTQMRADARGCFERHFQIERAVDSLLSILNEAPIPQ